MLGDAGAWERGEQMANSPLFIQRLIVYEPVRFAALARPVSLIPNMAWQVIVRKGSRSLVGGSSRMCVRTPLGFIDCCPRENRP